MKSRFLVCTILLVLFAAPAFADTIAISFANSGVSSGSLTSGVVSTASDLTFDGTVIEGGPFATLSIDLGSFTGSLLNGGSFMGANFELSSTSSVLLVTAFSGTWNKIGEDSYDLAGHFSTVFDGIRYTGVTNQRFQVSFDDGRACLFGLRGTTAITAAPVPEPGTLTLLGTGLAGLTGALYRKLRAATRQACP